jgi:hypothetical protein
MMGVGGCALGHASPAFGDKTAVQTGSLPDFRSIPFDTELFVKDRWTGLGASEYNPSPERVRRY